MSDSKQFLEFDAQLAALKKLSVEERLAALEYNVLGIRTEIALIRDVIDRKHEHLIKLLGSKDRIFEAIADRLDLIEDRLEPAFIKSFPDYGKCLLEIGAIIDTPRKR